MLPSQFVSEFNVLICTGSLKGRQRRLSIQGQQKGTLAHSPALDRLLKGLQQEEETSGLM